jgi:hypothetical protein
LGFRTYGLTLLDLFCGTGCMHSLQYKRATQQVLLLALLPET